MGRVRIVAGASRGCVDLSHPRPPPSLLHPDHAELGQAAWELEPANQKTKADLEHVLSEIAGMRVVLPERDG